VSEWWFPAAISRHALGFDVQFNRTLLAAGIIFVAAQCMLLFIVWRFRGRTRSATPAKRSAGGRLELVWTTATASLFLGLLFMGRHVWAGVQFTPAPPNSEVIEVLAKQFAWTFRYPGPDGHFGRTDIHLINDAADNPFGLDERDPFAKDDITSATLRIPVGRPVKLTLTSRDVIHSFFVRELRVKQDVVPGMQIPLHFQADTIGTYEVPCSELCGLGHHQMRTTVIVMAATEYERWKRGQTH
jgi:Heme/copper-type cytochrome/quinol oxidases, subunit 2